MTSYPLAEIADLADAWELRGPDWTRLRGFVDWMCFHPELIGEAILRAPEASGHARLDTLLAAIAEKLCDDEGLERPDWCAQVPGLDEPWEHSGTPRMIARDILAAPEQFKARNIWLAENNLWRPPGWWSDVNQ